ncbi:DMT family transporter [Albirhodobacter sp. R86504]|uniref:DMT family transporter n=1 Tax=Albirhodobacter sp. R86504 TaxID=3093848 RepID=UPI00366BB8FC
MLTLPANVRAALWMLGAVTGFISMAFAGRQLGGMHDTFEIMLWRSVVGIITVVIAARFAGTSNKIKARNLGLHLIRNLSHFTGQNLWFAALTMIPLAQLFAMEFSYPLWVALAAPFVLGEAMSRQRAVAVALGFAGILIVTRPWAVGGLETGTLLAIGCAFGFAGSALATKRLTTRAPLTEIMFWLSVMQAIFGLVCAGIDGDIAAPTMQSLPYLVIVGLAGLGAHSCMTRAFMIAPASVCAPVDFLRLPLVAILAWAVYGEEIGLPVVLGGAVILIANWINIQAGRRVKPML